MVPRERRRWRPGLAAAGLAGAVMTVYPPLPYRLQSGAVLELSAGVWFGLALSVYFWTAGGNRSLARALALTALSAAAFGVAFVAAAASEILVIGAADGLTRTPGRIHPQSLFAGGAAGALVVAASVFFLYGAGVSFRGRRIALCSAAGGVLGVAGHRLGEALQGVPPRGALTFAVLCLVWQTGLSVLLSFTLPIAAGTIFRRASSNTHHENSRRNRCSPVHDRTGPGADGQAEGGRLDRQMDRDDDTDGT